MSQEMPNGSSVVKNIVLVHGAFTDGSSWLKVIPLLEGMGYHAVAVQNPMRRVLTSDGPRDRNKFE